MLWPWGEEQSRTTKFSPGDPLEIHLGSLADQPATSQGSPRDPLGKSQEITRASWAIPRGAPADSLVITQGSAEDTCTMGYPGVTPGIAGIPQGVP